MKYMKLTKFTPLISITAIISAIFFFIYSVIQLIGYGISTGNISDVVFLSAHFQGIVQILLVIGIIASTIVYGGYAILSHEKKESFPKSSTYSLMIINFLVFIANFLFYSSQEIFNILNLNLGVMTSLLGVASIWFGCSLLIQRNKIPSFPKSIGVLYTLQGLVFISTLVLPLMLAEFTIAIRITEYFFFSEYAK